MSNSPFTAEDETWIKARGNSLSVALEQIKHFETGFPYMRNVAAASVGKDGGIVQLDDAALARYSAAYDDARLATAADKKLRVVKFVPASGAASRMFKELFALLEATRAVGGDRAAARALCDKFDEGKERPFFGQLRQFAFAELLTGGDAAELDRLLAEDRPRLLELLLTDAGLNYGALPKAVLQFHRYGDKTRTPIEEHLVEAALYGADGAGAAHLHFTVSPEHRAGVEAHVAAQAPLHEAARGVKFHVSYSEQHPSTDTVAVDPDNRPFRTVDGHPLFRPGGHGALLRNLNEVGRNADLVFIKNIDNVVPDRLKDTTVTYKKALAGVLLELTGKIAQADARLRPLEEQLAQGGADTLDEAALAELLRFVEHDLSVRPPPGLAERPAAERLAYVAGKLRRPARACGMVRNQGQAGGGPFWATNSDGSVSLQIVESAQIDANDAEQLAMLKNGSHFNPTDLVCSTRNAAGAPYDLEQFRDPQTGFISSKSLNGKPLKAQELPGLWNGAMAEWNSVFVEVPVSTFSPVKSCLDLLRPEHQ